MIRKSLTLLIPIVVIYSKNIQKSTQINRNIEKIDVLSEHTTVNDAKIFPFMAAVLKKSKFISAGALIDESWVLTGADSLFLIRESSRMIRVRLGSVNYRKGGFVTPIKFFEIHPYFDDSKPLFDVALIKLPNPVKLTPNLNPIRLQKKPRNVAATHFIVTSWPIVMNWNRTKNYRNSKELNKHRILTVSHLHPTDPEECTEELDMLVPDHNNTRAIMCFDSLIGSDPCQREIGAPVVLNGILWGIISSWKSEDCDVEGGPSFATLVSAIDVSTWIHSTIHAKKWNKKHVIVDYEDNYI
ncbi:trypsin-like [Nymphalis io]|uniref:trypsin-like n=1 Tax=Inachis io TaxID=171585 RepID=UPI00216AA6F3|nr:trypsin-like [Nymphalis io]XP_050356207.1 trypsin-like [Nymphalis io]XP_050356208.1 trypsin-like [Nymphalis io]XP_050356209.1 trypsin-like [Nymphalis io]